MNYPIPPIVGGIIAFLVGIIIAKSLWNLWKDGGETKAIGKIFALLVVFVVATDITASGAISKAFAALVVQLMGSIT